jgi:lysophospholipase L1-like esterase
MIRKVIACSTVYFLLASCSQSVTLPDYNTSYYRERITEFNKEAVVTGHVIFLGNSITAGGNWKQLTGDSTAINRGIAGDNTSGVLNRLGDIISLKPSKLFILIGLNDIAWDAREAAIADNYRKIITRLKKESPGTVIYFQSLLPVNNTAPGFLSKYDKLPSILVTNLLLKQLCIGMNIVYVDIYTLFLNGAQKLDINYTTDGVHLNTAGYQKWAAFLRAQHFL